MIGNPDSVFCPTVNGLGNDVAIYTQSPRYADADLAYRLAK